MAARIILVDAFVGDQQIGHFEFPLKLGESIVFPEEKPYDGLQYRISVGPDNTYEFSPDGYEMWVRFNDERVGRCVECLDGRSVLFLFKTRIVD